MNQMMNSKLRKFRSPLGFDFLTTEEDSSIYREFHHHNMYEAGTCHIIKNILRPGDVFVDVGSHHGQMTVLASRLVGKDGQVFAFEPMPETHRILHLNIANSSMHGNVNTENVAISNKDSDSEKIYLHKTAGTGGCSLDNKTNDFMLIKTKTIASSILSKCKKPIRMIKMDVEQHEKIVIKELLDYIKSYTEIMPALCLEFSGDIKYRTDLFNSILEQYLYKMMRLERNKGWAGKLIETSVEKTHDHDNLFCIPESMINELSRILV